MAPPNRRAQKVLKALVSEYLTTGEAVGSRTIARSGEIQLSPATVRNVLSDLEDLGLLAQPHTSAGRVPTPRGLRFFIDSLLKVRSLSQKERENIRSQYELGPADLEDVINRTSKVLSDITQYTGLVLLPSLARQRLHHIEFAPLRGDGRFLCILVTSGGKIENRVVELELEVSDTQMERIHNYLQELLGGLTLEEVRARVMQELGNEKNKYDEMVAAALTLSQAALEEKSEANVIVSGRANLLDSAMGDDELGKMKTLFQALEEKEILIRLLDRAADSEQVQVFLGAETAHSALDEASVVAMPYGPDEHPVGAIAVVGPTRMNYGKVMSVVDFTAGLITELLSDKD